MYFILFYPLLLTTDHGQLTTVNGRRSENNGQRTTDTQLSGALNWVINNFRAKKRLFDCTLEANGI
jgi:hypothetical protein